MSGDRMLVRVGADGAVDGRRVRAGELVEIAERDWPRWLGVRAMPAGLRTMTMTIALVRSDRPASPAAAAFRAITRGPHGSTPGGRSGPAARSPADVVDLDAVRRRAEAAMPPRFPRHYRHPA